ncbi:MAG: polysaccharide biosynthesis/export family protein, partial [Planctomycetes bacterium]|nr:polysaccharide biosynthesis/export family protein [Planctomycetota bacterium]
VGDLELNDRNEGQGRRKNHVPRKVKLDEFLALSASSANLMVIGGGAENNPFSSNIHNNYQLGAGDEVSLQIWNHPELSAPHVVGPDGMITLPLIGSVNVNSLSREKAAQLIKDKYEKYYPDLVCTLAVNRYVSQKFYALGSIKNPGMIPFHAPPTILEAISMAGGPNQTMSSLPQCAIIRGHYAMAWVDMHSLLHGGDLSANMRLKAGDVLYIPDWKNRPVAILGEVNRPGIQPFKPDMHVMDLISAASGFTRNAAKTSMILIRRRINAELEINNRDLKGDQSLWNVALEEGDILYVKTNFLSNFNYVINNINPFSWYFFSTGRSSIPSSSNNPYSFGR